MIHVFIGIACGAIASVLILYIGLLIPARELGYGIFSKRKLRDRLLYGIACMNFQVWRMISRRRKVNLDPRPGSLSVPDPKSLDRESQWWVLREMYAERLLNA